MQRLSQLIGTEHPLALNSRAMRDFARSQNAAVVGAMHVTCSDESERECAESFQHAFAGDLLPALKYSAHSPFRTATLGGRYEWGSATLAEQHFTVPDDEDGVKLLLVKLNSHVAVVREGNVQRYGTMDRYNVASQFCGAMFALLEGQQLPAVRNLAESFRSEGKDRIAILNDPDQVDPQHRMLLAAVVSARLQARRAVLEIQNATHQRNALIVVLPCVTLNRPDRDTELIVGAYTADFRHRNVDIRYRGLGDDPSRYRVSLSHNLLKIADDQLSHERPARDHRQMVLQQWRQREAEVLIDHEQMQDVVVLARRASAQAAAWKEALTTLLKLLAAAAPVPTAIFLFADGIAGIHNVYRATRLAMGKGTDEDAERILNEAASRIDMLSPQHARQVVAQLCDSYGISLDVGGEPPRDISAAVAEKEVIKSESPALVDDVAMSSTAATPTPQTRQMLREAKTELAPSVNLELGAAQRMELSSMPQPLAAMPEPTTMSAPSTPEIDTSVARIETPRIETSVASAISQPMIEETARPIVDNVDKADVIETRPIEMPDPPSYESTPEIQITDTKIADPIVITPAEVEIVEQRDDDIVVDAELVPIEDDSKAIEFEDVIQPIRFIDRRR